MKGYVQVYTGDGKGKTTAALELALRAAGAGQRVFIAQFAKGTTCSELPALERFADRIRLKQYGQEAFLDPDDMAEDVRCAQRGLREIGEVICSGDYRVVILDEANIAVMFGLLTADALLELVHRKPEHVELVITGRYAHPRIVAAADLVTDMREVKHYYKQGVAARVGIEK